MLTKLFEPASLGPLRVRNRIVMPPMATLFGGKDGTVSERLRAYYARRAEGGAGLIIVENTAIDPAGVNYPGTLEIHDPKFDAGLASLAKAIKARGAAAAIQLFHPGRQVHPKFAGNYPVAPSPIPCPVMGGEPKELTPDDIRALVRRFGEGAARAQAAGFDAVEVHGAHGYLVSQFLSPFSNRRTDGYGGGAAGRGRFCREIVAEIRARVGDAFPVILRISAEDKVEAGLTIAQARELVPFILPGITALHVSAGCYPSMEWVVQPYLQPRGCLVPLAKAMREVCDVPIIAVGRINETELAERVIAEGSADFVSMGRALMADPDLPIKSREGRFAEVRPCLACNVCIESVGHGQTQCAVNARMGHEREPAGRAEGRKKVMVVGGGPAGMEAALTAAARGHAVELFEAGPELGGQLIAAGVPGSKAEIRRLLDYYRHAVSHSNINAHLGARAGAAAVRELGPDLVIIATGALPAAPGFAVDEGPNVVEAVTVLREKREVAGKVVVIGGGPIGLDAAGWLADRGCEVTVLEMKKRPGGTLEWNVLKMTLASLKRKGVRVVVKAKVRRAGPGRVVYADQDGAERELAADGVVLAAGMAPHNPLAEAVRALGIKVAVIGDSLECRGLAGAVSGGYAAGAGVGDAG